MKRLFFQASFLSFLFILAAATIFLCQEKEKPESVLKENVNTNFLTNLFAGDSVLVELSKELVAKQVQILVFVSIKDQTLSVLSLADTFRVVFKAQISSGRGKSTPRGVFSILKKRVSRPSRKYGGIMTYWNCLTPDEAIGIHGLKDRSYLKSLGRPVSHGCIRIGKEQEKEFYTLAPIGTTVVIK